MYYEINVAKNGRHFFATAQRSITDEKHLRDVYNSFRETFKKPDYKITVTKYNLEGRGIIME